MTIREISEKVSGKVVSCADRSTFEIEYAFASDLMSDVLTVEKEKLVLITGLVNVQTIRTSEMSEIGCIILGRAKKANSEILSLAAENHLVIIESPYSVFRIAGELYKAGIKPVF